MKKRFSKIALLAGLATGLAFSNATTNKADARIAPGHLTGACINGTQWTYTWGWFGSNLTETIEPC